MNDERLQLEYQSLIQRPATGRDGCPSPEQLDALVTRQGAEEGRLATLNHAMACAECRRELDLLRAVHRALPETAWRPRAFALAATLMLATGATLVWRATHPLAPGPFRGTGSSVELLVPADGAPLAAPPVLVWRPVPGAASYRVEILDRAGAVVATGAGPDTVLRLPTHALAPADSAYRWRVIADLRTGGSVSSGVRRLRVNAP